MPSSLISAIFCGTVPRRVPLLAVFLRPPICLLLPPKAIPDILLLIQVIIVLGIKTLTLTIIVINCPGLLRETSIFSRLKSINTRCPPTNLILHTAPNPILIAVFANRILFVLAGSASTVLIIFVVALLLLLLALQIHKILHNIQNRPHLLHPIPLFIHRQPLRLLLFEQCLRRPVLRVQELLEYIFLGWRLVLD